jgi:hypothetical protein
MSMRTSHVQTIIHMPAETDNSGDRHWVLHLGAFHLWDGIIKISIQHSGILSCTVIMGGRFVMASTPTTAECGICLLS